MTLATIKLKLKDKQVELTAEEAKELKDLLNNLFAHPQIQYIPYPVYQYPQYVPVYRPWEVTCGLSNQAVGQCQTSGFCQLIN